ncbi:hypothetical protein SynPROS71_02449 [Synechococcus sp. PROS-7-1]|nr:hypothetical protein SynPROS71_02449 [Synechococcus sp. PROS-7-1]
MPRFFLGLDQLQSEDPDPRDSVCLKKGICLQTDPKETRETAQ